LASSFSESIEAPEALLLAARCADSLYNTAKSKEYRKQLFETYPKSSHAAEAYFAYYAFQEYLQSDRQAIKHLQAFPSKYPDSRFIIPANYLIGLDCKKDRRSPEGKWISKKNLTAAIDAFQQAESFFDLLYEQQKLPNKELEYFATVRYRATLERALANLAIADDSLDAKRKIYLEYTEDVLRGMQKDFNNPQHALYHSLFVTEGGKRIQEESSYWLAQACFKNHKEEEADHVLAGMLEKYQSVKITRGYLLSRTWYARAQIAISRNQHGLALQYLGLAEDASKGKVLTVDQKLELWIQQAHCYHALNQLDRALLMLSKAVNDDEVSGLRIKAMYLRGEVYEQQGRTEQARRQLDAASKKSGEWARKARDKLERNYGYPSIIQTAYSPY
jgi:tetratricopeptide (TPR) repeat protein